MVVVGVMAILASLLLPAFGRARTAARSVKCKSNLHQLGLAMRIYLDDFGKYPLVSAPIDLSRSTGPWKECRTIWLLTFVFRSKGPYLTGVFSAPNAFEHNPGCGVRSMTPRTAMRTVTTHLAVRQTVIGTVWGWGIPPTWTPPSRFW